MVIRIAHQDVLLPLLYECANLQSSDGITLAWHDSGRHSVDLFFETWADDAARTDNKVMLQLHNAHVPLTCR